MNTFGYATSDPLSLIDPSGTRVPNTVTSHAYTNLDEALKSLYSLQCVWAAAQLLDVRTTLNYYREVSYTIEKYYYRIIWRKTGTCNSDFTYDLSYDEPFSYGLAISGEVAPGWGSNIFVSDNIGFTEGSFFGKREFWF